MAKEGRYKSTELRMREICAIAEEHYEEGNYSKCYHAIWRNHIAPKYGICYRTFLNYVNASGKKDDDNGQMNLFK